MFRKNENPVQWWEEEPAPWQATQPATQRDRPAQAPQGGPHSAAAHFSSPLPEGSTASPRTYASAGAREGNAQTAQSQPHSAAGFSGAERDDRVEEHPFFSGAGTAPAAPTGPAGGPRDGAQEGPRDGGRDGERDVLDDDGEEFEPPEWADVRARIGGWLAGFRPPDVWTHKRPSLAEVWAYAARGEWTGEEGVPRRAGQVYAGVMLPVRAVLCWVDWILARPARLIFVIVLGVLASKGVL